MGKYPAKLKLTLIIPHPILTASQGDKLKKLIYHRHPKPRAIMALACEQALLFGRAKRVSRERASERRSREEQRKDPSAPSSHVLARLAQTGELARRLLWLLPKHIN